MPNCCAVVGCSNRSNRDKDVKFFRFPSVMNKQRVVEQSRVDRRNGWISALRRDDITEGILKNTRVCSEHFITGRPSNDPDHPDYLPNLKLGYEKTACRSRLARFERAKTREANQLAEISFENNEEASVDSIGDPANNEFVEVKKDQSTQTNIAFSQSSSKDEIDQNKNNQSTQTDTSIYEISEEITLLNSKLQDLQLRVNNLSFTEDAFCNNDQKTLFFTGIPSYSLLKTIFLRIEPFISSHTNALPNKFQHFIITLMRLRLNLSFRFLSYLFNCSIQTISRIFFSTIHILFSRLKSLIIWPSREQLRNTMPICFMEHFGKKVTVIIDCFEIFTETSSNLDAQASSWSNYKHHNTMKYLIGITPYGSICFISSGYGGRISDKLLTLECGFLDNLIPGDLVLADRGFLISDMVGLRCAVVKTPNFLKGKKQLEAKELEETRHIAAVRIHIERVIGVLRQKYTLLHETIPISLLKKKDGDGIPVLDKIVTVCCVLVNLCPSVVPL